MKKGYGKDGIDIDTNMINVEIIQLDGDTIQVQRSQKVHTRTISVFENSKLKYIIKFSNTNYDEDKRLEVERFGGKYVYNRKDYHSNTFYAITKILIC